MREGFKEELNGLLNQLRGKHTIEQHQTDKLFQLHNEHFSGSQEHGKSCSSCRSRVYKRMLLLCEEIKDK